MSLGRRHAACGVADEDYMTVGDALLGTLAHALGADFTEETRDAWASAYALIATAMQAGAREMREGVSARAPRVMPRMSEAAV